MNVVDLASFAKQRIQGLTHEGTRHDLRSSERHDDTEERCQLKRVQRNRD